MKMFDHGLAEGEFTACEDCEEPVTPSYDVQDGPDGSPATWITWVDRHGHSGTCTDGDQHSADPYGIEISCLDCYLNGAPCSNCLDDVRADRAYEAMRDGDR